NRRLQARAKVFDPSGPTLQTLRAAPGRVPQVWHLPDLLPQSGRPWFDSWRPQIELVEGTRFTMMTDPIADMLTRIRNAVSVERPNVEMPTSKVKRGIADVLKREGYIWDWTEEDTKPARSLRIDLKYGPNGE